MITFHKLGQMGRLGNQLFQYAALKSLALKNNYDIKIPNPNHVSWHGQQCLLNEFNIECGYLYDSDLSKIKYLYKEIDWKSYDTNFFSLPDDITIEGFFQSISYFDEFSEQIKKELTPKQEYIDRAREYINQIREKYPNYEIVSVHVRRGDNMTNGQTELINAFNSGGLYDTYFKSAKKVFDGKKVKFLVFTGGQRFNEDNKIDFDWCKNYFVGDEYLFSEGQIQMDDFSRIMLCDHNILSHASSFGWWAAYQNSNPNKIVVAPEYYHPDNPTLKRTNFYPTSYILC